MSGQSILCASLMAGPGIENGFTRALRHTFDEYHTIHPGHPKFNEELLYMVKEYKPEIVFLQIQAPNILTQETAREIAKHSFCMQFSGDIRAALEEHYVKIGREIQLTTFTNMADVETCRQIGIKAEWLEIGIDPERYRPWENIPIEFDIIAHFNDYGNLFELSQFRREAVAALKYEFGPRFCVFGNFNNACGNLNHDQVAESKNYMRSKLALNISHFVRKQYSSDRLGRITMTGGPLCLTHRFPDIEKMYQPGKHLVVFDSISDLIYQAKYYLEHEDERTQIVKAAREHALNNYSFDHMAKNILNLYHKNNSI